MPAYHGLAILAAAAGAPATLLVEVHSPRAWFGSSALALQGPRDPVAMTTTWVYAPEEIVGYRPAASANKSAPAWSEDTTKDLKYQTLYVESASGRTAALPKGTVDSLAFWNRKPHGITGDCHLIGFNSAAAPDLSFGPSRAGVVSQRPVARLCGPSLRRDVVLGARRRRGDARRRTDLDRRHG